jgi:hypothetical protein
MDSNFQYASNTGQTMALQCRLDQVDLVLLDDRWL